jgi:hypothetical protein
LTNRASREGSECRLLLRELPRGARRFVHIREKPLLFVDIDGVVSLFGFAMDERPDGAWQMVDGVVHFLSAEAGQHLLTLRADYELVWCSGWEEKCNEYLPHALGLPEDLPFLRFERNPGRVHAHWKLDAIEAFAGDRPLAWIDDALDDACHAWAARRGAPTLLVATDPPVGLTAAHAARLTEWARAR